MIALCLLLTVSSIFWFLYSWLLDQTMDAQISSTQENTMTILKTSKTDFSSKIDNKRG